MTLAQFAYVADVIHKNVVHGLIDELRNTFPGVDFYDVPFGDAAVRLWDLLESPFMYGDEVELIGSEAGVIFRDTEGRPGDILKEAALLVALRGTHDFSTPYDTLDLQSSAYKR
tara:strand:- start:1783 stop:2124 length:342 start_codon:yes stop_codon:yes gene_type:complete